MQFGGLSLFELLIIGGLVFVVFRVVSGMGQREDTSDRTGQGDRQKGPDQEDSLPRAEEAAQAAWDRLRSSPAPETSSQEGQEFDEQEFLQGARAVYARLQEAWDDRDIEDIANFTSPELLEKLRERSRKDSKRGRTELLLINAKLMDRRQEGSRETASVDFDVLLREGGTDREPHQSREVWHFARDRQDRNTSWRLESIEQLEG